MSKPVRRAAGESRRKFLSFAAGIGAAMVATIAAGAGPVARLSPNKKGENVSVTDFGAKGDNSADDTLRQQAAITYVQGTYDPKRYASASPANGSSSLFYPSGYYRTSGTLVVSKKIAFKGDGPAEFSSGSRIVQFSPAKDLVRIIPIEQGMSVSFENMALIGVGTGPGDLIRVTKASSGCNSQRYYGMVFGTPPALALNIEAGDDVIIDNCLFDVAALSVVAFGTSDAANQVTHVRFKTPAFFSVGQKCILLYNVDGMQIVSPQVYSGEARRTGHFIDGYNTMPYKIKDVSILGGNFKSIDCFIQASAVNNLKISGISCSNFGAGSGATLSGIELVGACAGVSIVGNTFSGSFDTRNFYNDAGAIVTQANITGNTFVNTGGVGQALKCANTSGVIANNTFVGFSAPSISEKVYTSGNSVKPGSIASLAKHTENFTVVGAIQGDRVIIGASGATWMAPIGIEVTAFISSVNTVSVEYRNVSAGPISILAHDISYTVVRGC